jgi:hypothetical protein
MRPPTQNQALRIPRRCNPVIEVRQFSFLISPGTRRAGLTQPRFPPRLVAGGVVPGAQFSMLARSRNSSELMSPRAKRQLAPAPKVEAGESKQQEQQQQHAPHDRRYRQRTFRQAVRAASSVEGYEWCHVGNAGDLACA